ncbi:protein tyrosine serine phosphatase [Moniliophthora roreri MCA 2997]|uniref:Protein tyrosine serine phosphatase n=2 Tax=Moniliophthora roreri TaxID=221103 RepID=V2WLY3_MONRO|nr:protein tyrosine serine phosphatase [Moniliophthora roreri MCA 2997]KAI3614080.1 protein tyrosine serine phosphatase [Moniliophthora roreri]
MSAQIKFSESPFVTIQGVINARVVGGYTTSSNIVKPAILYRSGDPSHITEKGIEQLRSLGIRHMFDLRADSEISSYAAATPSIGGVEIVKTPISQEKVFDPVSLAELMKQFETNELETFMDIYQSILELGGPAFEIILRHLLDKPDELCLVHCTAGKDRTGLLVALLLMVLGVDDQVIIEEYALTTIGLEPALPVLIERFKKNNVYRDNWQGTMNMGSSRPETMAAALEMIRNKYGGAEDYLKSHTSLDDNDIRNLRRNLLVQTSG